MTAGAAAHGALHAGASGDHRPDLDDVVVGQDRVPRYERVAPHDQHGLAVEVELAEELADGHGAGDVELAAGVAEEHAHGAPIVACRDPPIRTRGRRPADDRPSRSASWACGGAT